MKLKIYLIISLVCIFAITISSSAKDTEKDSKQVTKKQTVQQAEKKAEVKPPTEKTEVTIVETKTEQQSTIHINPQFEIPTPSSVSPMTGEQINWQVISSGGTQGSSTNFIVSGTVGQTAIGYASSTNFQVNSGYWQSFVSGSGGCCFSVRGNIDNNPDPDVAGIGGIDIADLVYLVAYSFSGGPAPVCTEEADVDASGGAIPIDIADIVYVVNFMFGGGPAPLSCT